ncbi:MAG TPA: PIN domain-containing protein [Candidatus Binatia bacterium]|jgi:predicted nucleic acid-binding protein
MQRIVIDTNIYIDWINDGLYETVIFQRDAVKHLSAIVMMELGAGAFSPPDRKIVRDLASVFARVGRILTPTVSMYQDAAEVLRQLQVSFHYTLPSAHGLANDVLIALSARSIGAVVFTQNDRDFSAIQRIRPFKLALVSVHDRSTKE